MESNQFSHFRIDDFIGNDEAFHISRVNISRLEDLSFHNHDYAELFWIESGHGTHHINGKKVDLQPYDIVMIRPHDVHTFSSRKGDLIVVNIAFKTESLDFYRQRYFHQSNQYFWSDGALPYHIHSSSETISRFASHLETTIKMRHSLMLLDSIMLSIFNTIVSEQVQIGNNSHTPQWLINVMEQFKRPEYFLTGCNGFAQMCRRNPDYISRIIKKNFNLTLSEYVNSVKMEYAANQLIMTNMPIKEICSKCGFGSLSHFYSLFGHTFHTSPHQYRTLNQKII